ncbi:hypothetical protein [Herbaspirillum sp. RV1423]|uniref:transcriptional regulator n=1 Tax=Herbaspirillum sp. RV1423 TaxID=1443993 RepID=UPI0004B29C7F|nr:hypothetical protein [Herbaspirillum sp. RV1423]
MTLIEYLNSLPMDRRAELAARCQTSFDYLRQIGYGNRPCSPLIAVCLERASQGAITRKTLFPDDWAKLWPELEEKGNSD